eukprot:GHVQ01032835.1.p1 GENE.GHVQ01032835.1~~GHVQ01032835.1.p1  ORF type:complete len:263 (+),score=36.59 GHVQ01032835.1:624-1412(+)
MASHSPARSSHRHSLQHAFVRAVSLFSCHHHSSSEHSTELQCSGGFEEHNSGLRKKRSNNNKIDQSSSSAVASREPEDSTDGVGRNGISSGSTTDRNDHQQHHDIWKIVTSHSHDRLAHEKNHGATLLNNSSLLKNLSNAEKEAQEIIVKSRRQQESLLRKARDAAETEVSAFRDKHASELESLRHTLDEETAAGKMREEEFTVSRVDCDPKSKNREECVQLILDGVLKLEFSLSRTAKRTMNTEAQKNAVDNYEDILHAVV